MRKTFLFGIAILAIAALISIPVSAANPHDGTTGQPGQNCEALFAAGALFPPGFNTDGFAHATTMYAGSGHTANGNNPKAVSQYDVACFQQYMRLFG